MKFYNCLSNKFILFPFGGNGQYPYLCEVIYATK